MADLRSGIRISPALSEIGLSEETVTYIDTGTLNAAFIAEKSGESWFVKTHLDSSGRESLYKECAILEVLYQNELSPQYIETGGSSNRTERRGWLVMKALSPPRVDYSFDRVSEFADDLVANLQNFKNESLIPKDDSVFTLLSEAWASLDNLSAHALISSEIYRSVRLHLTRLDTELGKCRPCVCHGDLGPKNLMTDGKRVLAIDWEDAFWGVEGYDFLFWLTFFSNRKYYSPDILGKTPLGKPLECSLLVMILLLKCALSFKDGSYRFNSISFDQRINEILALQ